jgi:uncharacterized protein
MSQSETVTLVTQTLKLPYDYTLGETLSEFFVTLRDQGKIMGKSCPKCNAVLFPPRKSCGRCLSQTQGWVDLSGKGVVESFTVVNYNEPTLPEKAPYILGQIKLDGAQGGITHIIKGIDADQIKIGMKVQAVIRSERDGTLKDIECFKPV